MMNNKVISALAMACLFTHISYAGNPYGEETQQDTQQTEEEEGAGPLYPRKVDNSQTTKRYKFELNIDKVIAKEVRTKAEDYRKTLLGTDGIEVSMTPLIKPFRSMDEIKVSSEYQTVIRFPKGYKINKNPSFSLPLDSEPIVSENLLSFKVNRDFIEGNIVIPLHSKEKNIAVVIRLMRYDNIPELKKTDKVTPLYTYITYIDKPKSSKLDVIKEYFRLKGDDCHSVFRKNGNFDTLLHKGIVYYIIRDDEFGEIETENINYRVEISYEEFK